MSEIELTSHGISPEDNKTNVEMTDDEIWFLKSFIKKYHPKKIVEIGVSAGGNTVNLLKWKDEDAQLFSVDICRQWYRDETKLSGFMADEKKKKKNWKIYRGYDYLDIYDKIGNDIDCIIIDTVHAMPGEFFTFIAALPQLKDGCIVILHDIHSNMDYFSLNKFSNYNIAAYCTGLLFGGVGSNEKYSLKSKYLSNIGAFIVDNNTRNNIKDIFHILCASWYNFPFELDLIKYSEYIHENYPIDCYNLFKSCLKLQLNYFCHNKKNYNARIDIINSNIADNAIEIVDVSEYTNITFPNWFKSDQGAGVVLQTIENSFDLIIKCINDGTLKIALKGPDFHENGERIPVYIDFNNLKVNEEDIIKDTLSVWHDEPYIVEKNVTDGEIIKIHAEWSLSKS